MKTQSEDKMDKKSVAEILATPADLHIKNSEIVLKTGVANAVILLALIVASYYVSVHTIAWLTLLMPVIALIIGWKQRIYASSTDVVFYIGWQIAWSITFSFAVAGCILKEFPLNALFLLYYICLISAMGVIYEMLRVRYAAIFICAAFGLVLSNIRCLFDSDISVRMELVCFFLFTLIVFIIGGLVFKWQIKTRSKNPANFPDSDK